MNTPVAYCRRCGALLTDPVSVTRHIGPVCERRPIRFRSGFRIDLSHLSLDYAQLQRLLRRRGAESAIYRRVCSPKMDNFQR